MWNDLDPSTTHFYEINRLFAHSFSGKKRGGVSELIRARYPIRIGGMTDCFTGLERKYGLSFHLLELLKEYDYPYLILTKNSLISQDEYLKVLDPKLAYIQFSITTPFDQLSKIYEPGADTSSERIRAAKILSENGFAVAARICPLIPNFPDGYYSRGENQESQPLQYFSWELVDQLSEAGIRTVIAGFLRLNYYNNNRAKILQATGYDLGLLFSTEARKANDALYFSIEEKRIYYEKLQKLVHEAGMRFTVCYDGDEAYEVFRPLWDNPDDCCDAPFIRPLDLFGLDE
jgi:DNA repair photolyase